jgi:DNA-binding HxlR family transcriptional regulator
VVKRTYQQYCGLAAALDVVGERWALLIVRDLAPGPRRFTDLFDGLPGIATDVLAERLRALEAAGAVARVESKHPAPAKLYALTDRGEELARISSELARWGMPLLSGATAATHRKNPAWALQTMARNYRGGLPDGEYRWTVDDREFHIAVEGDGAAMSYGHGAGAAVLSVRCSEVGFFRLLGGRPGRRMPSGVDVDGSPELLLDLVAAMPTGVTRSETA